ncbi:YggS family pyridoxal phosphate-dependent enzyme [archaeon]|nr:YggS family pyridoxal phosphate-dependent enzyme [archaeon]
MSDITMNVRELLSILPDGAELVVAAKGRTLPEVKETINAGVRIIGENYVQESLEMIKALGEDSKIVKWHFIGHLQKNKVKRVVSTHDMIETLDSLKLAEKIDRQCRLENRIMSVLIEVNSAEESQKQGVMPCDVLPLAKEVSKLAYVRLEGLMTMGPINQDPTPYFMKTRTVFKELQGLGLPNTKIMYLSMGMSDSYEKALNEGANLIRVGSKIFGLRHN